jgi:hypothetical protein
MSRTKQWAVALLVGLPLAGLLILADRTTGWLSVASYCLAAAAVVTAIVYAITCQRDPWHEE